MDRLTKITFRELRQQGCHGIIVCRADYKCSHSSFAMNFQVTVLKVLASYPDGYASLTDLKRDMAILAASGKDWTKRSKRLAARSPNLEIFSQGLVV